MLSTIAVVGLAPLPVLVGFAAFYIATALYYRLPIPVQPMKAVAAVLLTAQLSPAELAASGVMIGVALLLLGLTGRSEEHTSELQSLMRISYAVFCLKKKKQTKHA